MQYASSFEQFLASTNEKQIFAETLHDVLGLDESRHMLDLGAGNGDLSVRLRAHVGKYVAIEANPDFCDQLRQLDVEVVQGEYPDVDQKLGDEAAVFDVVLSSYSSPVEPAPLNDFLDVAWQRVDKGGVLALITFGENDDWAATMEHIENVVPLTELRGYSTSESSLSGRSTWLHRKCDELGEQRAYEIQTDIRTATIEELFQVVGFLAAAGEPAALEAYYAARSGVLPILERYGEPLIQHKHTLLAVDKAAEQ